MLSNRDGAPGRRVKPRSWQENALLRQYQQSRIELAEELRRNGNLGEPGEVLSGYNRCKP